MSTHMTHWCRGSTFKIALLFAVVLSQSVTSFSYSVAVAGTQQDGIQWSSILLNDADRRLEVGRSSLSDPVTIHTTFRTDPEWEPTECSGGEIILVGLATDADAREAGLLLSWSCDTDSWFPRWVIRLRSETGWNPVLVMAGDPERPANTAGAVELVSTPPQGGHAYDVTLSYSIGTNEGALSIVDLTLGRQLFSGSFRTSTHSQPLFALAGAVGALASSMSDFPQAILSVDSTYIPIGTDWRMCALSEGTFIDTALFRADEQPYFEITAPLGTANGRYRLWAERDGVRTLLGTIEGVPRKTLREALPPLPIGRCTVAVEYVAEGRVIWTDSRTVTNGVIQFFSDPVSVDRAQGVAMGAFRVIGEGVPPIPLSVSAKITRMTWDGASRSFLEGPCQELRVFTGSLVPSYNPVEYSLSVPPEPGLYKLTLSATSPEGVVIRSTDQPRMFNTYLPAKVSIRIDI